MVFAALSTVLGVCENILAMVRELTGLSRPKGALLCGVGIFLLALTTALGYSVLHFQPLPRARPGWICGISLFPITFCRWVHWYWRCSAATLSVGGGTLFVQEANTGKGLKVQPWMKPIFRFVVPAAIAFIYIYGMATFAWN